MLDYILQEHEMWMLMLGLLTVVSAVETFAAKNNRVPLVDRLLNIGIGACYLVVGGYLAFLLFFWLARLHVFRDSELDTTMYVLLFVFLQDVIYYFYHRMQHSWPLLWQIHKLHHTDTDVNVTTSFRTHVFEQPLQTLLIFVPVIFILGFHPAGVMIAFFFTMFFLYFGHSRLDLDLGPLSRVLVGPQFHRLHHSLDARHLNRNFAQYFSFLDLIFGTYRSPRPLSKTQTGIRGCRSRKAQVASIFWPLSAVWESDPKAGA